MKYPLVGDTFYWKGDDGEVHEDVCMKIEQQDNPDVETMYFTYLSENDGGVFVTEDCLINPLSMEIRIYKDNKCKKEIEYVASKFADENFRSLVYPIVRRFLDEDYASMLLDQLSEPEFYERYEYT